MSDPQLHRYRIECARGDELRFVAHLDMQLVWERTFRRARLPLAYSQGFNPRPRFHMACALPLGFTSRRELVDLWLVDALPAEEIAGRVTAAAPPGLEIRSVEEIALTLPALQTRVTAAVYRVELRGALPAAGLAQAVEALLACPTLPREWRGKPYDLRPLIYALSAPAPDRLEMHLSAREGATARPEEVLDALGLDPAAARVERSQLLLVD